MTQVATFHCGSNGIASDNKDLENRKNSLRTGLLAGSFGYKARIYEKDTSSGGLKNIFLSSIDLHNKLCCNKKSENKKHHTGRKQVTSSPTPHNQLGVPPPD